MKARGIISIALILGVFCLFAATSAPAAEEKAVEGVMTEQSDMSSDAEYLGTEEYEAIEDEDMDLEAAPKGSYMEADEDFEEGTVESTVESTDDDDMGDE